jgi:hypothetical protein
MTGFPVEDPENVDLLQPCRRRFPARARPVLLTCKTPGVQYLAWYIADVTGAPRTRVALAPLAPDGTARITVEPLAPTDTLQVAEVSPLAPATAV